MSTVPKYLQQHEQLWRQEPREANRQWFVRAGWGMFIHYGLYSQLGRGEWALFHERIPLARYEELFRTFDPCRFDVDEITDLALEAGMSYINLTSCHHEGFCLWRSAAEPFNSARACGRDLVAELARACARKGLGFFVYYTHVLNWRHPYAAGREMIDCARPDYDFDEPRYRLRAEADFARYWEYAHACLGELLALEWPLAGVWLDLILAYYRRPDLIPIDATYRLIRDRRPEAMIAFKQGATGTEDFAAPEFSFNSLASRLAENPAAAERAEQAWRSNRDKHNEICMTLQHHGWGYDRESAHHDADAVWQRLAYARKHRCNMLANVGLLPDGSFHPDDIRTLREVGRRLSARGWPPPEDAIEPESWTRNRRNAAALA